MSRTSFISPRNQDEDKDGTLRQRIARLEHDYQRLLNVGNQAAQQCWVYGNLLVESERKSPLPKQEALSAARQLPCRRLHQATPPIIITIFLFPWYPVFVSTRNGPRHKRRRGLHPSSRQQQSHPVLLGRSDHQTRCRRRREMGEFRVAGRECVVRQLGPFSLPMAGRARARLTSSRCFGIGSHG